MGGKELTDNEFTLLMMKMKDRSVYDSSEILRGETIDLVRDDNTVVWLNIFSNKGYCHNFFSSN